MQFSAIYRSESKGKYIDILYIDILGKEIREFFKNFLAKPVGTAGKNQIDFLLIRMLKGGSSSPDEVTMPGGPQLDVEKSIYTNRYKVVTPKFSVSSLDGAYCTSKHMQGNSTIDFQTFIYHFMH